MILGRFLESNLTYGCNRDYVSLFKIFFGWSYHWNMTGNINTMLPGTSGISRRKRSPRVVLVVFFRKRGFFRKSELFSEKLAGIGGG
jgi:hypothetical protein